MPRTIRFALVPSLVAASCLALGQDVVTATATLQPSGEVRYQASYRFHIALPAGEPVLNAPYSADEVESSGPGSAPRILQKLARDAQGRTRQEKTIPNGSQTAHLITLIEICDVTSGWVYILDPRTKTAHRYHPPLPGAAVLQAPARQAVEVATATANKPLHRFTVPAPDFDAGTQPPKTATLPPNATIPAATPPPQDLGERLQEGLHLHGIRYPAAATGGRTPGTATEVWVSPALQLIVETRFVSAQGYERTVRLTHLAHSAPDPALFRVPADYRVEDEPADFPINVDLEVPPRAN